jgi:methanogenic corrinoid protein MtbC1
MTPTLEKIGERWEAGDVALSQVYMSGIICEELVDSLLSHSSSPSAEPPRIAVVTFEDYHVLGKRILRSILAAQGIQVLDYGHGIQKDELLERVCRDEIEILLISTLMLPSALRIRLVREGLDALGRKVNIVVGGAPFRFDDQLWKRIGADAMGHTASEAIRIIRNFEEEKS